MLHYRQAIARTLFDFCVKWKGGGKSTVDSYLKYTEIKRKSVPPVKSTFLSSGKIVYVPCTGQPASSYRCVGPACATLCEYTRTYRISNFSFLHRSSSSNFVQNQPDFVVEHVFVVSSEWLGTFHLLIKWTGAFFSSLLAVSNCFFSFSFHVRSLHYWFLWDNLWLYF